jgi:transcriptional regulator NrdR family protein
MILQVKVRKADGSVEPWNYDKVLNSVAKAGVALSVAENVILILEAWARNVSKEGIVNSSDVRDKIIEVLRGVDPIAADAYQVYKK